jgi:hypothetical protein
MTGYTVHTGSTEKFSEGWDRIFTSKARPSGKTASKSAGGKAASAKSGKRGSTAKRKK